MSDDELNAAIDDVARQMTEVLPAGGADFRRRVLARIEPAGSPPRLRRAAFVATAIAAAAVLIAMVEFRSGEQRRARPIPTPPAAAERAARPNPDTPPQRGTPAPQPVARSIRAAGLPATAAAAATPTLQAAEIDPLEVAPLTVSPLTPDPIQVERLESIAPIAVAPLDTLDPQRRYE